MLRTLVFAILAATATSQAYAEVAPDFRLPGTSNTVALKEYRGKAVYVDFWASWCGPCRKSFPWLNQMQTRYGKKGLTIVGINLDKERALADSFLKENPANFTLAFDPEGKVADAFQVKGMPSSFLVDKQGNVVYKHQGFRDQDTAELEKKIKSAVEGN